jgi:hypothetical protein
VLDISAAKGAFAMLRMTPGTTAAGTTAKAGSSCVHLRFPHLPKEGKYGAPGFCAIKTDCWLKCLSGGMA